MMPFVDQATNDKPVAAFDNIPTTLWDIAVLLDRGRVLLLLGENDIMACSVRRNSTGGEVLLTNFPLTPRLPAADIDRARKWYETKLGLTPNRSEEIGQGLWYQTGGGWFYLPDPDRWHRTEHGGWLDSDRPRSRG
jgi:hypothetical protein